MNDDAPLEPVPVPEAVADAEVVVLLEPALVLVALCEASPVAAADEVDDGVGTAVVVAPLEPVPVPVAL